MTSLNLDLFEFWRLVLGTICTIYAALMILRSVLRWSAEFVGSSRRQQMMRNYALVLLLRTRVRSFVGEFAQVVLLLALLGVLLRLHHG